MSAASAPTSCSGAGRAIGYGGLVVGVLDGLDAVIFFALRGVPANRIFQHIASAVLGKSSFSMGATSVALGAALHFAVAFAIVTTFWLVSSALPGLRRRWLVSGTIFGLLAYGGMNYVVIPLTRAAGSGGLPPWPQLVNGLLAHIFLVGIPAAWIAHRYGRRMA